MVSFYGKQKFEVKTISFQCEGNSTKEIVIPSTYKKISKLKVKYIQLSMPGTQTFEIARGQIHLKIIPMQHGQYSERRLIPSSPKEEVIIVVHRKPAVQEPVSRTVVIVIHKFDLQFVDAAVETQHVEDHDFCFLVASVDQVMDALHVSMGNDCGFLDEPRRAREGARWGRIHDMYGIRVETSFALRGPGQAEEAQQFSELRHLWRLVKHCWRFFSCYFRSRDRGRHVGLRRRACTYLYICLFCG